MAAKGKKKGEGGTIVIRKIDGGGHGHHGGAWKVAYADFVTAMMAFFLLMWLLNATSEEQRRGIADYFSPTHILAQGASGSGQPFGGRTANSEGAMVSDAGMVRVDQATRPLDHDPEEEHEEGEPAPPTAPRAQGGAALGRWQGSGTPPPAGTSPRLTEAEINEAAAAAAEALAEATLREELAKRERDSFERATEELREAVAKDPALAELGRNLVVEQVPQGLRIQLIDADRQPMFASGSTVPNERARTLIARIAQAIAGLPNRLQIVGHTDATPFRAGGGRGNWELSAERANAIRRLLVEQGVADSRITSVAGAAAREPLLPETPNAAGNRRVALTLLRDVDPTPGATAR